MFQIGDIVVVIDCDRIAHNCFAYVIDVEDNICELCFFDEVESNIPHYSFDEIQKVSNV